MEEKRVHLVKETEEVKVGRFEKVKGFGKEHKIAIAVTGAVVVTAVGVYFYMKGIEPDVIMDVVEEGPWEE